MNYDDLLRVALAGGLTFGVASVATASSATNSAMRGKMSIVKCNDCESPDHSCAGQGGQARDGNAVVAA